MAAIYGLFDGDGNLRYIGKAENPERRLNGHMREVHRRQTPLYSWLAKHGRPELRVLEADCPDWRASERRLIREARARGERLLNIADGGDEPHCPVELRRENARRLNQRLADDPQLRFLRDAKRTLSKALKDGRLREETKEKMRRIAILMPGMFGAWRAI